MGLGAGGLVAAEPVCGGAWQVQLSGADFCVIVATDGLWEFVSNEAVADTVHKLRAEHPDDEVLMCGRRKGRCSCEVGEDPLR